MRGMEPGGGWPSIPGYVNFKPLISIVGSEFSPAPIASETGVNIKRKRRRGRVLRDRAGEFGEH